jgi:hypothetical protein
MKDGSSGKIGVAFAAKAIILAQMAAVPQKPLPH